jgi:molecular chaperone GrpE
MNDKEKIDIKKAKMAPGKEWAKVAEMPKDSAAENDEKQNTEKTSEIPPQLLEHPSYIELENDLVKAETERDAYRDQLLLAKADLENSRRRFERDLTNAYRYAVDKLVAELLAVVDSLERGLEIKSSDENQELVTKMQAGMKLTLDLLLKTLQKYDVSQINPLGEVFNPTQHEAIAVQDDPEAAPNTVLKVVQKGYLLKDRLLRPALVVVKKSE